MPIQSLQQGAGTGKIKKRIRDLERLLRKPGLAATKKTEAERALESFKNDLEAASKQNKVKTIAKRYHMVRFFEKKKAVRALRKEQAGDKELAAYYYVVNFPVESKYSALYAEGAEGWDHPFMSEIKKQISSEKLLGGREGIEKVLAQVAASTRATQAENARSRKQPAKAKKPEPVPEQEEEDDEEDEEEQDDDEEQDDEEEMDEDEDEDEDDVEEDEEDDEESE